MKAESQRSDNVAVIRLEGRFDAHEAAAVRGLLLDAAEPGPAHVVVNLAGVNFVDSTGLATLVQGMKRAREMDGDVYLCQIRQPVRIIFELTRLDRAFQIFETEGEAVEAFAS